jgi:hypothetical protein
MDRVAVGRRGGDLLRGDVAAGAGAVLDDDGLPDVLGELLRNDARRRVGAAAGREAHGERDRMGREILLRVERRRGERREQECD